MGKLIAFAFIILYSTFALGTEVKSVTLLSLLGDNINVVSFRPETGSHLDQNRRYFLHAGEGTIGTLITSVASFAITSSNALTGFQVKGLTYSAIGETAPWIDGGKFNPPPNLLAAITKSDASHLLIFVPHRAPSMLKVKRGSIGSGHLEGIGFYVDRETKMRRSDTGEIGIGFIAPYAYIKLILVNVASGDVEREQIISASSTFSVARNSDSFDPWEALDTKQKVAAIQRLLRNELTKVLPTMLK